MIQKIMEAAKNEIMLRGLKFTIRDLAAALGVSTKTIYQHFDSKEAIISSLIRQAIDEMRESETVVLHDASMSAVQKLQSMLAAAPAWFHLGDVRVLQELKLRYPQQWAELDEHVSAGWDMVRQVVQAGIQEGSLRPFDLDLFIQVYVGGLYQLLDSKGGRRAGVPLEQALSRMVEMLVYGVVAEKA